MFDSREAPLADLSDAHVVGDVNRPCLKEPIKVAAVEERRIGTDLLSIESSARSPRGLIAAPGPRTRVRRPAIGLWSRCGPYFVGASRLNSSSQFWTTTRLVEVASTCGSRCLIMRNRRPSGDTS